MHMVELSNHPGDMLNDASRQRLAAEKRALDGYEDALIQYRARADKYDNYGNLVEQRPIADRKGRSPSVQLNEAADDLERFLRERRHPVTVQRVVILAHRRSRLGAREHLTVLVGASTDYLLTLLGDSADHLGDKQRAEIQRLIQQDHDFHHKRRRTGPTTPR